jgi:hypothetical protein
VLIESLKRPCRAPELALIRKVAAPHACVRQEGRIVKSRIMYIERKGDGLTGEARIGRVTFTRTGATLRCGGRAFQSLKGSGFKANYFDVETGEHYWISGCKKDGSDRLYGERVPVAIDDDVREEYWTEIRGEPENRHRRST